MINALQTPAVESSAAIDSKCRLESVKQTREVLITDPNSKAHLRIGKLKGKRKRASLAARSAGARADSGGSAGGFSGDAGAASGGSQRVGGKEALTGSEGDYAGAHYDHRRQHLSPRSAFVGAGGGGGSDGMDGLLEAAASLSDGETPGTPTRDQPDELRDRSPRISGFTVPSEGSGGWAGPGAGTGVGAGFGTVPSTGRGGLWDAAAVLGALKPGGAFTPVVAPRPTRPVPHNAATRAPSEHIAPKASGTVARFEPGNPYAAAMAAFVHRPPVGAAEAGAGAWAGAGVAAPCAVPGMYPQMSASIGGMNPHMAQMLAWIQMAAMGGAAHHHQAQQQQQQHAQQPLPVAWNPAAFQQMAASNCASNPPASGLAPPRQLQVAHQPL